MASRLHLIFFGAAAAALAYAVLGAWSARHEPPWVRFERAWAADVRALERSKGLPPEWFDVRDVDVTGGTAETRAWLTRVRTPIVGRPEGRYRLDVLVVAWAEASKRGVLVQYDLEDLKTRNTRFEIGRTLILSSPDPWREALPWLPR